MSLLKGNHKKMIAQTLGYIEWMMTLPKQAEFRRERDRIRGQSSAIPAKAFRRISATAREVSFPLFCNPWT